jgi:hypothetical protein
MGWQDYHLHEFEIGGKRYGVPDEEFDQPGEVVKDSTVKLSRALSRKGASLLYSYDFGYNWAHSVILEDIVPINRTQNIRAFSTERGPVRQRTPAALWLRADLVDPRQAETQRAPPDGGVGREELRPREVISESGQSYAETNPAKSPAP